MIQTDESVVLTHLLEATKRYQAIIFRPKLPSGRNPVQALTL